jgi:hypothetical protein
VLVSVVALCACVHSRRAQQGADADAGTAMDFDAARDDVVTDAPTADVPAADRVAPACDQSGFVQGVSVETHVSLVNPMDALRVEGVTVRGSGRICIAQQGPTQTTAWTEGTSGSRYELRFTADGYAPYTVAFDSGGFPASEPVVMVRGVVMGPVVIDAIQRPVPVGWAIRPGTNDLFVALDGTWHVVRRTAGVLTATSLDPPAPSLPDLASLATFTPDGELALLPTAPRGVRTVGCVAVAGNGGGVLARDLSPGLCASARVFAAHGLVGVGTDDRTQENVVFAWGSAGYREIRRVAGTQFSALDAGGVHALHTDARSNPLIYDVAAGTERATSRATENFSRPGRRRYLLADGSATLFVESGTEAGLAGRSCGTGGCSIYLEPVSAPFRSIATGVAAWALSDSVPALVYATPAGALHRYDLAPSNDVVVTTMPFDVASTFAFENAFVMHDAASLQIVNLERGAVVIALPGVLSLEPDPRVGFTAPAALTVARACIGIECEVSVVDLHSFRFTRSRGNPFLGGARGWYERASGQFTAGDATMPAAGWPIFAGAGAQLADMTTSSIAGFPCVPFRWQSQWVCGP